jgi:DNA-binding response OmpR family regulator
MELFAAAEGQVIELVERTHELRASADAVPTAQVCTGKVTVMIADDSPVAMHMLVNALEPERFRIVTATDGLSALDVARTEIPDLILIDWEMPGLSGVQVCKQVRNEPNPALKTVPIVLFTSHEEPDDLQEAFDAGVTDYLTKPFSASTLRARVDAWLLRHSKVATDHPQ